MGQYNLDEKYAKKLEESYKKHCAGLTESDLMIEKEALERQLGYAQLRIDTSHTKINVYTAIAVVVIPFIFTLFDWSYVDTSKWLIWVIIFAICYISLNISMLIFQAIRVRGVNICRFSGLKECCDKKIEANWQLYYDWQQRKRNADMFVSFVSLTQRWVIAFFIFIIAFAAILQFNTATKANHERIYTLTPIHGKYCATIQWDDIVKELEYNKYTKIIIIHNKADIKELQHDLNRKGFENITDVVDVSLNKEVKMILEE